MSNASPDFPASFLLLIEHEAGSGAWNMAVDEALLESARQHHLTAVRFYRWNEPTLSLGYFQKQLPENLPAELTPLPRVRRLSGGGAILHHHEWTYSCVLSPEHPLASEPVRLYELVHQEIITWLGEQSVLANLRGTVSLGQCEEPFLCFGREDPRDIVHDGKKIVGSAQRRRRGAVLQHGSLLYERSDFAPTYPGLQDLTNTQSPTPDQIQPLAARIAKVLHPTLDDEEILVADALPLPTYEMAQQLERENYRQLNE